MVDKSRLSINDLRRAIKEERGNISKTQERRALELELLELRRGQRPGVQLVRRLGRGLRVTSKKVGGAISRQAQRIAEQQERQRIATQKARKGTTIRKKKGKRIIRVKGQKPQQVFVQGLGFVTPSGQTQPQPRQKIIRKKRRKVRRQVPQPQQDDGFFGGSLDLGI